MVCFILSESSFVTRKVGLGIDNNSCVIFYHIQLDKKKFIILEEFNMRQNINIF